MSTSLDVSHPPLYLYLYLLFWRLSRNASILILPKITLPSSMMKSSSIWLSLAGLAVRATAQAVPSNTSSYNVTEFGPNPVEFVILDPNDASNGWVYDVIPLTSEAYTNLPVCIRQASLIAKGSAHPV